MHDPRKVRHPQRSSRDPDGRGNRTDRLPAPARPPQARQCAGIILHARQAQGNPESQTVGATRSPRNQLRSAASSNASRCRQPSDPRRRRSSRAPSLPATRARLAAQAASAWFCRKLLRLSEEAVDLLRLGSQRGKLCDITQGLNGPLSTPTSAQSSRPWHSRPEFHASVQEETPRQAGPYLKGIRPRR